MPTNTVGKATRRKQKSGQSVFYLSTLGLQGALPSANDDKRSSTGHAYRTFSILYSDLPTHATMPRTLPTFGKPTIPVRKDMHTGLDLQQVSTDGLNGVADMIALSNSRCRLLKVPAIENTHRLQYQNRGVSRSLRDSYLWQETLRVVKNNLIQKRVSAKP